MKMPEYRIHKYIENVSEAEFLGHHIVHDFDRFLRIELNEILLEHQTNDLKIYFDISSINRVMMFRVLAELSRLCRSNYKLKILYCPAAFSEPDWRFPQIESLGPIGPEFSGYNADPSKPLCLILGLGFEPGVSMGIISQLEPSASFCFWGTGSDSRFDQAVRRANFDFEFTGFNTRTISYIVSDPQGSFQMIESLIYGLARNFNVILVPMGPKIFSFLAYLLALTYPGDLAIWRAQQRRIQPSDAKPDKNAVYARLDIPTLKHRAEEQSRMLGQVRS
ncbi:hypothetical protein J2X72_001369 [Phyllobacterium sp. 1468]|uniref:hypothetical protein n=1 Tax=Phyllobacterium sp. 1468 TaxID=2817759 RepID=UPI0028597A47|nr:hypothetical protein [Phyllobacterium sp. 1468]MDR6632585.1 hypothetical protein [Phyllobacterium sp. 1468]